MTDRTKDRILGAMLGYAVGDALGLGTEFMTAPEAALRYPGGLTGYDSIIRDAHRSMWQRGQWTNDTEIMMRLTDDIVQHGGINLNSMARRLADWYEEDPSDMPLCMRWSVSDPAYVSDPLGTAQSVWERMGDAEPRNEAVGRALFGAMMKRRHEQETVDLVHLTHWGAPCTAAAVVVAHAAHGLLWNGEVPPFEELVQLCRSYDRESLPALLTARHGTLQELELDDPRTLWHARKTMAAALWPLWHCDTLEETMNAVVMAAGDADTNAAMAMSLAGMKYGASSIPAHLVDGLVERDRLLETGRRWTEFLEQYTSTGE